MARSLVYCGLCAIAVALLSLTSLAQQLERQIGLGLLYAIRGHLSAPEGALIVGLDRASIGWLQRNIDALGDVSRGLDGCLSPHAREELSRARNINQVPRALHACLIRRLVEREPRLIVFDINFNAETPDDAFLAEAIRSARNVLLLERIEENGVARRLSPSTPLSGAALGTVFFQTDGSLGEVVTGYPAHNRFFPTIPAMPVEAWRHHVGREPGAADAIAEFQPIWLYGPAGTVPTVPVRRVFEADAAALPADLSRSTVFIGASDASDRSAYDHFKAPLLFVESDLVGGVELAATAFLNLLHNERMASLPPPAAAGVVLCYAFVALLASRFLGGRRAFGGVLAIAAAYCATAVALFVSMRLWVPVSAPLIVATPLAVLSVFSARFDVARRIVERLAPRPFARELLRHPEISRGHSNIEEATIMFADMVGSTALAERLGEDAFREVMNRYYSAATAAVEANGGMVVEYMGDGILALFTAGVAGPEHAMRACRAAQQISTSPARRPEGSVAPDRAAFRLRFGIHSGRVVTGPTGAEHRYSFKALGDSVNVAARLEEHGKKLRQDGADIILLSADTRRRTTLSDEVLRPLGMTKLRGRSREVEIFRLASEHTF
jgi:class 3 adenylate cyclase/CHASE2 domain-containing sensor protein